MVSHRRSPVFDVSHAAFLMHPPKDMIMPPVDQGTGRSTANSTASARDMADWQALYTAMLGHITGNVETWLQNYLAQMMAAGQSPADQLRAAPAVPSGAVTSENPDLRFVIPPWLEPFKDPTNVRFTRTPDHILMQERGMWAQVGPLKDDEVVNLQQAREDRDRRDEASAPIAAVTSSFDRSPYVLPPNVRNTRTPDRILSRIEPEVAADAPSTISPNATAQDAIDGVMAEAFEVGRLAVAVDDDIAGLKPAVETDATILPGDADLDVETHLVQPWGRVVLLGAIALPVIPAEQDNVREALAGFLSATQVVDAPLPQEDFNLEPDAIESDEQNGDDANLIDQSLAEAPAPMAAVASSVVEMIRPSMPPINALHLSMMGNLHQTAKPIRVRGPRGEWVYEHPPLDLLIEPVKSTGIVMTRDALEQHARLLEGVLEDFGIRGEIINVRPGPVVTLYELEPAPGIKSSRVVGLADDIARSMSAISARVAVVQGRNVIGIELPNQRRDTVYLRELVASEDFSQSKHKLAIALGKTIGGEPVIVDLARMPHLLVAGTTGSGKSVAINTMILSLLYRLKPEECRLIMVDPKMLELSVYDGIPHLLTPVVTDPKKAVVALKWAVREMEDRYKKMSKVGVRNIDGFNVRVAEAKAKGEVITRTVQTGFDRQSGEPIFELEEMDLTVLPYIVVIVDEMADLMMVAGKEIEGAIQRLAQMARAAGIHLIMATQRPSVDVITGTIKANFPTRISFQVTSKIDSRTILGEQGAEQLLGQGDMLHMMGGGRISRVHGPFVSDHEVELVVAHLKTQGQPEYLDVTVDDTEQTADAVAGEEGTEDGAVFDKSAMSEDGNDLYEQAVKVVLRDKKCSTSYIQRRLSVGYNKAASLVERMEKEGIVAPANHAGKREILIYSRDMRTINIDLPDEAEDA